MRRTQRKVLSILLSLAMLCSLAVPTAFATDNRYSDTTDHWAEAAIGRWSDYGIVEGYGDAFNPDNAITRAQMATILSKTLGLTETTENPFSDVYVDEWYTPYVLSCYKADIMLGDNGKANPNAEITRQEAMTMFCRAFAIQADEKADLTAFKDSGEVSDWALPYVSALINSGIVSGVSSDMLAPADKMSRAALVTVLDRAVVQYINTSGEYDLADKEGIILVAAGDTTLKGETKADVLITQAADGKAVTFKDATVTGAVTVQGETKIVNNNSKLPEIDAEIELVKAEEEKKTTRRRGGSSGSSAPVISDLTISEEKAVTSGTYNNVTITDAVADGEVTLSNITINGDLTINGGGSSSIKLVGCTIQGKVIMAKESGAAPRLELTNTPITAVEVQKPAIIEAVDRASAVTKIETTANIEIKGENTKVDTLAIAETAENVVAVNVSAGNVATVEAKAETTVTGASNAVNTIIATAAVTADSAAVQKVEIPETATESVCITVAGTEAVDVEINSTNGVAVTGTNVTVSTTLETAPDNITVGGTAVTHIHKWGEPVTTPASCEQDGENVYTCIADGCDDTAKTKTEVIIKLGHNYGDWKLSDNDLHVRECANDKEHYEKQEHTWDEGKITTEANCGQEGVKTYTCSVCKGTKTETIGKPEHNWGDWAKVDATSHKRVCKNNATHIETADHTPIIDSAVDATCTETGKTEGSHCDICNSVIIEQTTTPTLTHDFTGEYEKDADGHWHICERDNCEETDTKAGHTYNTTNCAEVATCTVCGYEKAAGEHTWGEWVKVDEENHKHTCPCSATETAGHKWDDGIITTDPTETKEGVKTYTCPECKGTKTESVPMVGASNIWFSESQYGYPIVEWTPFELADGEMYVCNDMEWFENSGYLYFELLNIEESGYIPITISKGTWDNKTPVYTENEAIHATITDTEQNLSLVEESDGRYKITSHLNNFDAGCFIYQVRSKNGNPLMTGFTTGKITVSPCENIDVVVRQVKWNISSDKKRVEYTITPLYEITTYTDTQTQTEDTYVSTYDELKAALDKGGVVKLNVDIQTTSMLTLNTGDPAVLDLNGHTLDIPRIATNNGKSLTINQTIDGSSLINSNGTQEVTAYYADLTLNGGIYEKIGSQWANNITLNGIEGRNSDYSFYYGKNVSITNCIFGNDTNASRINIWEAENANIVDTALYGNILFSDVNKAVVEDTTVAASYDPITCQTNTNLELKNVKATAESGAIRVHSGCNVTIDGGEYDTTTSYSTLMYMIDGPSVTIKGGKFTGGKNLANPSSAGKGTLNISGGDFIYYKTALLGNTMNCNISGGSFGYDVSEYIGDSCACTSNSDGTYTVSSSEENKNNIWLEMDGDDLNIVFEDNEGLSGNELYALYQNGEELSGETSNCIELSWYFKNVTENTTLSYEIKKGTWSNMTPLAKLDDAVKITINSTVPNASITPQSDGSYKLSSPSNTGFYYIVKEPGGDSINSGYSSDGVILCGLYEGCTIDVRECSITVAEDRLSANVIMSSIETLTDITLATSSSEEVEVSNLMGLQSAVNEGKIAVLTDDITSESKIYFKTGAPSTIKLNGHSITAPYLHVGAGKDLTIDGSVQGSKINNRLFANWYAKLTLTGGSYDYIQLFKVRDFDATNITAQNSTQNYVLNANNCLDVTLKNSTLTNSNTNSYSHAINAGGNSKLTLDNVIASATSDYSSGAYISECANVVINGGTYTSAQHKNIWIWGGEGTFNFDPTPYLEDSSLTVTPNADGTYTISGKLQ